MKNNINHKIVLFTLDEPRYSLYLSSVERVIRCVEITPLPKAPSIIFGVINYHGEVIPVIDMRKRFCLPLREINLEDQFIIAKTSKRFVVLVVDLVEGIYDLEENKVIDAEKAFPYADYLKGVVKSEKGIILISDLDKFLSLDEEKLLNIALSEELV